MGQQSQNHANQDWHFTHWDQGEKKWYPVHDWKMSRGELRKQETEIKDINFSKIDFREREVVEVDDLQG